MEVTELEVVEIGESLGVVLPPDLLERVGLSEGDDLTLTETESGFLVTRTAP